MSWPEAFFYSASVVAASITLTIIVLVWMAGRGVGQKDQGRPELRARLGAPKTGLPKPTTDIPTGGAVKGP